jgi:serine/threonine-protein kinase TTK/MPS1
MGLYSSGSASLRKTSRYVRKDSPLTAINASQGYRTKNEPHESDDDDGIQPPPMFSAFGRSVLAEHEEPASPRVASRTTRTRQMSRNASPSNTPARSTTTPAAPSQRVKRIGLSGAPVRRGKRTPQSEEEQAHEETHAHHQEHEAEEDQPPSRDQENVMSVLRSKAKSLHIVQPPIMDSIRKQPEDPRQVAAMRQPSDRPLAQKSSNTPHRPAPPPPPKMAVLEAATKSTGASTTKKKSRRANLVLNGKTYNLVERCGKGGSAEVWRVTAEDGKPFALKKVRLHGQEPQAIQGYKGEIDLLSKLQATSRVVKMYDYSIDLEKEVLYVVSTSFLTDDEANDVSSSWNSDKAISAKFSPPNSRMELPLMLWTRRLHTENSILLLFATGGRRCFSAWLLCTTRTLCIQI